MTVIILSAPLQPIRHRRIQPPSETLSLGTPVVTPRPHYTRFRPAPGVLRPSTTSLTRNRKPALMPANTHHADALKALFRDVFRCPGREFGSPSRGVLGISDGNEGVQWNAAYYPGDGAVCLGVNLEGMKYDDWPVARLIEREISRPLLLTRFRRKVARPDIVTVVWSRDAWQYSARRRIKEATIAPTPIALDRLDGQRWAEALLGARECLDPQKQLRGRRKVPVTLLPSKRHPWERQVEMEVTPHLKIRTPLAEITSRAMREGRENLEGVWEFVGEQSRPYRHRSGL